MFGIGRQMLRMVVKLKKFEIEHLINEMSFKAITVVKCDFF